MHLVVNHVKRTMFDYALPNFNDFIWVLGALFKINKYLIACRGRCNGGEESNFTGIRQDVMKHNSK